MSVEQNKAHARRFFEAWNQKTPEALDTLLAEDFVSHEGLPGVTPDREGLKQWLSIVINAFPDIHFEIKAQVSEGDLVVTRWTASGTHQDTFMGIPGTGKKVVVSGIGIVRIENGQSKESWVEWDALGMMQQLGVVPAPEAAAV